MTSIRLIAFDLDGTLIDSLPSITHHVNDQLRANDLPSLSQEEVGALLGHGSRYLIEKALDKTAGSSLSAEKREEILAAYSHAYESQPTKGTEIYPGVEEGLKQLDQEGIQLAVLSNKPDNIVQPIMKSLFPQTPFQAIQGTLPGVRPKPYPDVLLEILAELDLSPQEVAYIGDTEVDAQLGSNAGVKTILVSYGFRDKKDLEATGLPVYDSFDQAIKAALKEN